MSGAIGAYAEFLLTRYSGPVELGYAFPNTLPAVRVSLEPIGLPVKGVSQIRANLHAAEQLCLRLEAGGFGNFSRVRQLA